MGVPWLEANSHFSLGRVAYLPVYVKHCDQSFQSKYSSLSTDSVADAILGDLMSLGDDSLKFICSWPALIQTNSLVWECFFT